MGHMWRTVGLIIHTEQIKMFVIGCSFHGDRDLERLMEFTHKYSKILRMEFFILTAVAISFAYPSSFERKSEENLVPSRCWQIEAAFSDTIHCHHHTVI